jgi:hypothetical protein
MIQFREFGQLVRQFTFEPISPHSASTSHIILIGPTPEDSADAPTIFYHFFFQFQCIFIEQFAPEAKIIHLKFR